MSRLLQTISGEGFVSQIWEEPDGRVWFVADFDNDADGGSNPDHDPDWQPDTSLHFPKQPGGKAIDAERVPGIVVPGWLPKSVKGVVLGCKGRATNLRNMKSADAVVHDTGPLKKDGEGTPELARRIGINPNARNGGEDSAAVLYEIWPGVPAVVDGVQFQLQPS